MLKHIPIVMLFDKSGSMDGKPIELLNELLIEFKEMFKECNFKGFALDIERLSAVDVCIIAFGGKGTDGRERDIEVLQNFAPATEMFYDKPLIANESTPLARAVETGLEKIAEIKKLYRENDIEYFRPYLVCFTDGKSTCEDEAYYNSVRQRLKKAVDKRQVFAYGIAVGEDCDYKKLKEFFGDGHIYKLNRADACAFKEIFRPVDDDLGPLPSPWD